MDKDLAATRRAVDRALALWLEESLAGSSALAPPVRHAVLAPGKRIRPLLLLAARAAALGDGLNCDGRSGDPASANSLPEGRRDALFRLACGPELIHAYSLIHDDLPCMDDDSVRRGRPTVHVQFGERAAIIAGAALMPLAVQAVGDGAVGLGLPDDVAGRLIATLTTASGAAGMVGGQCLDIQAEGSGADLEMIERIHLGKTAQLITACCTMGGIAAQAANETVDRLARFGVAIGRAFQTVDDILDVTGSSDRMGKAQGRDAAQGKVTIVSVLGLEGARERAAQLGRTALREVEPLEGADMLRELGRRILSRER